MFRLISSLQAPAWPPVKPSGNFAPACTSNLFLWNTWVSTFLRGVPMPRYLTQHTLACLTRQGAEALAQRMQAGGTARADRVQVNMLEGKMFVEFHADSREALEGWLKTEGMHFDFLVRIEWEMRGDKLQPAE